MGRIVGPLPDLCGNAGTLALRTGTVKRGSS